VPERILEVYNDGQLYKKYRVAVGKSETPTPVGEWKVVWKDYNWGSGFGTRWMGLNVPWGIYGIHGTNNPCQSVDMPVTGVYVCEIEMLKNYLNGLP